MTTYQKALKPSWCNQATISELFKEAQGCAHPGKSEEEGYLADAGNSYRGQLRGCMRCLSQGTEAMATIPPCQV